MTKEQQKQMRRCLVWAYLYALDWRGSLTGNPDPYPLRYFDFRLNQCRQILNQTRAKRKHR